MEPTRPGFVLRVTKLLSLGTALTLAGPITAPAQPTNLAVTVRHAPNLNGNGRIEGSLQQLLGENVTLNGGFTLTGDLLVPGSPALRTNGNPIIAGIIAGTGSISPGGYQVTLNGNCSLNYLRTRTPPVSLPTVATPPQPAGTRSVTINKAGQSFGDPATLRDLTLNGNTGLVSVPPGTYGNFAVNGGSGLVLGVAGGLQAVNYNLQNLTLNGTATLKVVGPVVLTVANGFTANGTVGASNNPAWLQLRVAGGGFTLNGGCTVYGLVAAPNGTVIVNGNSLLVGTSASDQFTLNGGGVVRWAGSSAQTVQPPVATNQTITLAENSFTNITLTGSDPQGLTLTFSVLTQPAHGSLSGTPPGVSYRPATNYFGNDSFTFKANNGVTDSAPATVSVIVTQVYYPPVAYARSLTNFEDTVLPVTLTGSDPQGYALNYSVVTQPAHGALTGTAPNLKYLPATNYFGNDAFTFRVNDGVSNSAPATISITNQPVDDPPAVVAGPDQFIILPTNTVSLAGSVLFDAFPGAVDTVVWSQVSGPGTVTFSNFSNVMTLATFSASGIYRLRLFASDSFLSSSDDLSVTVDAPPMVNAGLSMTNTFPGTIALPGTASDDGLPTNGTCTVRWSLVNGPGTVVFGDAAATNSSATFSTNGVYVLRLTADDGVATNHSDVTVIENLPPVVNAGINILTNGLQAALNGSVSDDGLPGGSLVTQWSQSSGPGRISFGNAAATNTTITATESGTYVLTLAASDSAATNSGEMVVTFNLPPTVDAGPTQTVNFGAPVALAGTVTDDQLPHNVLNCTWTEVDGPGSATFADVTLTNTTVTFDQPGIYALRLTADDGLATTSASVVVKVNAAPVVSAGVDQTVSFGSLLVLSGSVSDDGIPGLAVATKWTQVSGPADATFADPTATTTSVNLSQPGAYVFRLTADDGLTNSSAEVTITVMPVVPANHPPVAQGQNLSVTENSPLNITLTGTDTDGDALTFAIATQPLHGALNGTAPNLTYTPAPDFTGSDSFIFKVNDGRADSAPATVAINVSAVTSTLHLNVPGEQTIPHAQPLVFSAARSISITDEDNDLGVLELSLSVSNGTLILGTSDELEWQTGENGTSYQVVQGTLDNLNAALASLTYLNSSNFSGPDSLNLAVDDLGHNDLGVNSKDEKTVPITVLPPPNSPPCVSIVAPADASQFQSGQAITVEATAADNDGQVTNITLLADGLKLASLSGPPFAATWTGAVLGKHILSATATDNRGATTISADVAIWVVDENGDFLVEAGPDQIVSLPNSAALAGTVVIQTPVAGGVTNVTWSKLDGAGDVQFSDPNALSATAQFSEPGSYVLKLQVAYAGGFRSDLLDVDVLPLPPNRLTAARSNRGSDFWLTFLSNLQPYTELPYIGRNLYASATMDTVGTVTYLEGCTVHEERFEVQAGSVTTIPIYTADNNYSLSDWVQNRAIHVTTDHPVMLFGLNYEVCTTDGYLALPTAMLGTDYIVLAYRNSPGWQDPQYIAGGTQFAVVATENDTHVAIVPTASANSRIAGVPFNLLLQQGETYRLINYDDPDADFTGTTIRSDKPVSVFGGHECALVPARVGTADHLVEQLPPVNEWGRHFVTMPLAPRVNGDTFRFLAATNGTRLAINGKIVASLDRGQFYEQIIQGPAEILASKPILVAQYANGCNFDVDYGNGDPFMMLIPPLEQFGGDCMLSTPSFWTWRDMQDEDIYTDHLNLIVRTNGIGLIQLDDALVPANQFQLIGTSGYAGAQLPIGPGTHHLSAPVPFGACIYGWAWCESYAFIGGFYSDSAEPDTRLELTQPTPFAAVGHEKTVFARITNGRGLPISDLELSFSALGANTATGRALTSRFGQAEFSYVGANAGEDVITVSLVEFNQSVTNTWIAGSDNSPPVVSTADTPTLQLGLTAQLTGAVSDDGRPVGANLNTRWHFLGGTGDVQFEDDMQSSTLAFCSLPGTYQFELTADDSQFSSRSVVNVTVVRPFTVTIGGVDPGSWFSTNASLQLCANIDMLDGVYTNVAFFDGDQKLSEGMSTCLTLDSPTPGEHSITVVVTEEHGLQVRSEPLEFFVTFPPQIDVTLPDHDLTLPYGYPTATFKAHAWDPDGTITNFYIEVGSQQIFQTNEDEIDFTGLAQDEAAENTTYGGVPVRFVATDNHGISAQVAPVNINLLPPAITANLISPTNGTCFRLGQTIDFLAEASETPPARLTAGCIAYRPSWSGRWWWWVDYWSWTNGPSTTETHLGHWTPTETGDFDFAAAAAAPGLDFQLSSAVTIHVLPAIGVSIATPTNSEHWYVGTPSPIVLALDDPTEVFDHAEFFADGTSLGLTTNVWCEWVPLQIGNHTLTAKVYDHQGQSYNADAPVTIQAVPPPPPEVVITSPKNGDRLAMGQQTFVAVDVNDPAQAVTNLELLVDGFKVSDALDSYIPWTPASTGNHGLTVVATDWNGNRVTSASVTVTVVEMHPPTVTVTSPADGVHYTVETLPPLHAEAADSDGTVTNLTLELDGAVLGDTNGATLELSPTNILGGWHTVLARATDNDGLGSASASVSFFIERSVDASLPVPQQLAAEVTSATEIQLT